jgi:hypothetical protein
MSDIPSVSWFEPSDRQIWIGREGVLGFQWITDDGSIFPVAPIPSQNIRATKPIVAIATVMGLRM